MPGCQTRSPISFHCPRRFCAWRQSTWHSENKVYNEPISMQIVSLILWPLYCAFNIYSIVVTCLGPVYPKVQALNWSQKPASLKFLSSAPTVWCRGVSTKQNEEGLNCVFNYAISLYPCEADTQAPIHCFPLHTHAYFHCWFASTTCSSPLCTHFYLRPLNLPPHSENKRDFLPSRCVSALEMCAVLIISH